MKSGANKKNHLSKKRIVMAISGGVDSSVAAALLKKQGYDIICVFMKFWQDSNNKEKQTENRCCSLESEKRARQVAKILNVPFYVFNFEKEFKKKVVDYFLKEYKQGNTPNPCVVCNKEIKFGLLLEKALKLGADYVATGHYVKLRNTKEYEYTKTKNKKNSHIRPIRKTKLSNLAFEFNVLNLKEGLSNGIRKKFVFRSLIKAKDLNKDQSYFLWQLNQKQLSHVLFPIGNYTKKEVRDLAKKFGLPTFETPESQEICFVPTGTNDFLKKYLKTKPGKIIDKEGNILGKHEGLHFYTIGQRKGIDIIFSKKTPEEKPFYVIGKDIKKNVLIISQNEKNLLKKELTVKNVNWVSGVTPKLPLKVKAKIRYRSELALATIKKNPGTKTYSLKFNVAQKAITPGQSAVFYLFRRLVRRNPVFKRNEGGSFAKNGTKADASEELIGGGIIK